MKKIVCFLFAALAITLFAACKAQVTPSQPSMPTENNSLSIEPEEPENSNTNSLNYKNDIYGFSLEFPKTWEGYTTSPRKLDWGTIGQMDSIDFGFEEERVIFNLSIYSKEQWVTLQKEEGSKPNYLAENSEYVFASSKTQDTTKTERLAEVNSILETFQAK